MLGKSIFNKTTINQFSTYIDLNHLTQGIYHLKIITENQTFTHKIVKR